MLDSLYQFFDRHLMTIDLIFLAYCTFSFGWFYWRKWHRSALDVALGPADADDHPFAVTVVNRSSYVVAIRRIDFHIYSEDLNRRKQEVLKQRIEVRRQVDVRLEPRQSSTFDLRHRQGNRDEVYPLRLRQVVSDLHELGVEIAELSALVFDDKSQVYESNTLRVPVYRLVSTDGATRLTDTGGAIGA